MGKSAIVLGASGVTGTELMKLLIEDEEFDQIIVISRSKGKLEHPKIKEIITDLLHLKQIASECKADVLFCCIGTTKAQTPDKTTYKAIDYGIPVQAAKIAKANGINTFIVVSALGADPNSSIFYNRTKGEM
ncbi:NAD(P)H-binding protein [Flavobacterium luminosum]|uniref:NAD(P)H-binding protein n=1 Tax=Flavobacterium luminosum TaxID=2949086 RepID=UPI00293F23C3|nr:NAD(P)H-binding protein [Flavobacterium sp. HXWNR70]